MPVGSTAGLGKDQRGAGVTDSHAAPVPSRLPPAGSGGDCGDRCPFSALPPAARPGHRLPACSAPLPRTRSPPRPPETPHRLPRGRPLRGRAAPTAPRGEGGGPPGTGPFPPTPGSASPWRLGLQRGTGVKKGAGKSPAPLWGWGGGASEALAGGSLPAGSQEGGAGLWVCRLTLPSRDGRMLTRDAPGEKPI